VIFRWEHTPEWSYTSKLLISKHQQVQLLEAASILVTMNPQDQMGESAHDGSSEHSSASPAASGASDHEGYNSSTHTTPPPGDNPLSPSLAAHMRKPSKRYSSNSSAYSRSYQSAPSGLLAGSAPTGSSNFASQFSPPPSREFGSRPTSGQSDDELLAGALNMLSSSFGTPKNGPVMLPHDIPPVPPLPARFAQGSHSGSTATPTHPYTESYRREVQAYDDVKMEGGEESAAEDDDERSSYSRGRSDEDEDGVFGRMEE
jgi:hypothetical protein